MAHYVLRCAINGIKVTNPKGLIPIENRKFFLVKLTKEIQEKDENYVIGTVLSGKKEAVYADGKKYVPMNLTSIAFEGDPLRTGSFKNFAMAPVEGHNSQFFVANVKTRFRHTFFGA